MTNFRLFRNWMASLLVATVMTQCNKKEIENDPKPNEQQMSIAAIAACAMSIQPNQAVVDGSNIPAGSVVCLPAGTRGALLLKNFSGSPSAPITFINDGGQVVVKTSTSTSYGIKMENCKYFRFTGTGSNDKYGFKIDGGNNSFMIDKLSTNFEVNNFEISNSGFAGIMAKTDPSCDPATWRANFTMRDLSFHDNYVHHVKGEGFYIGNSFYNSGRDLSCGKILPHSIVNVKVYNNIVSNSGAEGIQVGCVIEGLKVYNNTVESFGVDPFAAFQNNGIQIGEGSGGLLYNNIVKNGPGNGLQILGYGDNVVFNNLVLNAGSFGIFADERFTPGNGFKFINNTIVNSGKDGIMLYSELVPMNHIYNNIIIGPRNGVFVGKKSGVRVTETSNYYNADINSIKFVNASGGNYQLAAGSPAIDKGTNVSSYGVAIDYTNGARPAGGAFDIGAYEANAVGGVIVNPTPNPTPELNPNPTTPITQAVTSFTLINADTDKDISTLTEGYVIDFATIGTSNLSIRANTNPATVGSVRFALDGNANLRTESGAPYAINGDAGNNYTAWTPTVGMHKLTGTPYSAANAGASKGKELTINFTVKGVATTTPPATTQSLTSFTLINADTDKEIATLSNGYVIDFAKIGTSRLSIKANTAPGVVGSVRFALDGNSNFRTESGLPYTINGDAVTDFFAWTPSVGVHTLTGTPYSSINASGTKGTSLTLNFTVVNGTSVPPVVVDPTTSLKVYPTDDVYLDGQNRYNTKLVRIAPNNRTGFVKYTVSGLGTSKPASAKIRFKVDSDNGFGTIRIAKGSHNNWTQNNISSSNKPTEIATVATLNSRYDIGKVYEVDVTSAIAGDGIYSFIITMSSGGSDFAFSAIEGNRKPELVISK